MARRKSKFNKSNRRLTLTDLLWYACCEDIDNFSAFFDACMKNHLKSRIKKDVVYKKALLDKFGYDLFFLLDSPNVGVNYSSISNLSDDELNSLVDGL